MTSIHNPQLDLNLIKVFDALLETRNVSRAAKRLGVSQSAVSHSLSRLRTLVGDPLFVRTGNQMEPSPRAQRLAQPLRDVLIAAAQALSLEETFEPGNEERRFTIGAFDSVQPILLTKVLWDSSRQQIAIAIISLDPEATLDAMDNGSIDMAIGYFPTIRRWHDRQSLYTEKLVCLFNARLVPLEPPISLEDYTRFPHLMPSMRGGFSSFVDDELHALGTKRRVAASTTQFMTIPTMLTQVPMLSTLPGKVADLSAGPLGLTISPLPFPSEAYEMSLIWHRRHSASPSHSWLREKIASVAATL
jgi:LysR family transcriptional regulator, mexEF-oprN operon transcriptional activator